MKRILGIDSSIPRGSVALLEHDRILSQQSFAGSASFSSCLLLMVDEVLSEAGVELEHVDAFGVTTGPGSFTGLRVGLSLVKGLVLATEKPFAGVDTLLAVAACVAPTPLPVCAILDARKKEVYCAFFRYQSGCLNRIAPDRTLSPKQLCNAITEPTVFIGSGLETYGDYFSDALQSRYLSNPDLTDTTVAASTARLARNRMNGLEDLDALTLNYVRKPEAELNLSRNL